MSWLFEDPIVTVNWLNFDHTQSNTKKWSEKIKLPQMRFFLIKQLIKFSCTSWYLLLSKTDKKIWDQFQVKRTPYHFCSKMTKLVWMRLFSEKNIKIISMSLLAHFIVENYKTILTSDQDLWGRMWHSGSSMAHLHQTRIFFWISH